MLDKTESFSQLAAPLCLLWSSACLKSPANEYIIRATIEDVWLRFWLVWEVRVWVREMRLDVWGKGKKASC